MHWLPFLAVPILGAIGAVGVWCTTPSSQTPAAFSRTVQEDVAQLALLELIKQTVLLERLVVVVERWDADERAARADAEARHQQFFGGMAPTPLPTGLPELPTRLERVR